MTAWQKGFPQSSGMYLVEVDDGSLLVTPWSDGKDYCEADGDYRKRGWSCLRDWGGKVLRWCPLADARQALDGFTPPERADEQARA